MGGVAVKVRIGADLGLEEDRVKEGLPMCFLRWEPFEYARRLQEKQMERMQWNRK